MTREEAIRYLERHGFIADDVKDMCIEALAKDCSECTRRKFYQEGYQDGINADKWIPCSERLPDKAGFYVVTKRQRSGEIQVALGSYRPLFNEWSGNGNFKDVLAWLPLPEPYKGE